MKDKILYYPKKKNAHNIKNRQKTFMYMIEFFALLINKMKKSYFSWLLKL